jgi:hypothetical protein
MMLALGCAGTAGPEDPGFDADDEKSDAPVSAKRSIIRGTVGDTFEGKLDPSVMGDVCIVYVQSGREVLGLIENAASCRNVRAWSARRDAKVRFESTKTRRVRSLRKLTVLGEFDRTANRTVTQYYYFYGVLEAEAESTERECLFGDTYATVMEGAAAVRVTSKRVLRATGISAMAETEKMQIVEAMHQARREDVVTIEDAFARADEREINRLELRDVAGQGRYIAFEFGLGDNSYGAIFPLAARAPVARIEDGDIEGCSAFVPNSAPPSGGTPGGNATVLPLSLDDFRSTSDGYQVDAAQVSGDTLVFRLSFGGGCEPHQFGLHWNGSFTEGSPKEVDLVLRHNANDDLCEAMLHPTVSFDLRPLREATSPTENGRVSIRVLNFEGRPLSDLGQLLYVY